APGIRQLVPPLPERRPARALAGAATHVPGRAADPGPHALRQSLRQHRPWALGWTLACGSGKGLADLVAGTKPDIDLSGFSLDRSEPHLPAERPTSPA